MEIASCFLTRREKKVLEVSSGFCFLLVGSYSNEEGEKVTKNQKQIEK